MYDDVTGSPMALLNKNGPGAVPKLSLWQEHEGPSRGQADVSRRQLHLGLFCSLVKGGVGSNGPLSYTPPFRSLLLLSRSLLLLSRSLLLLSRSLLLLGA